MELEPIERAALEKLLEGDNTLLAKLREQLPTIVVISREYTGPGFYTHLGPGERTQLVVTQKPLLLIDGVDAEIEGLECGAGFQVYVENGVLSMFEAFSYEEIWPRALGRYSLSFHEPGRSELLRSLT